MKRAELWEDDDGTFFSTERLCSIITKKHTTAQELIDHVNTEVKTFVGDAPVRDDITMVALQQKDVTPK